MDCSVFGGEKHRLNDILTCSELLFFFLLAGRASCKCLFPPSTQLCYTQTRPPSVRHDPIHAEVCSELKRGIELQH